MSEGRRALRAARQEKKEHKKRVRRLQRDVRKSQVRMTVVNGSIDAQSAMSLTRELQQCNSALLYADEVTLVSPRAALLRSAQLISQSDGIELLSVLRNVAPRYFPQFRDELESTMAIVEGLPPRNIWTSRQRVEYDNQVRGLVRGLRPIRDHMQQIVEEMFSVSGYDQLQDAINAGILIIDDVEGVDISDLIGDEEHTMMLGFMNKIDDVLSDGGRYPLFDADTNNLVRLGLEIGYFSPVPMARRLGADAAMADGLFDRLPNFQYATTREILDIRTELSSSLGAFRQGVRSLTDDIKLSPEDPQFGNEVEDAWNQKVVPALDEIEATIAQNTSMTDLMKRGAKDPIGAASVTAGITLPATLAVAAGPVGQYIAAAGLVVGLAVPAARALIEEYQELRNAKKAQFYFLFGTNEMLNTPTGF